MMLVLGYCVSKGGSTYIKTLNLKNFNLSSIYHCKNDMSLQEKSKYTWLAHSSFVEGKIKDPEEILREIHYRKY